MDIAIAEIDLLPADVRRVFEHVRTTLWWVESSDGNRRVVKREDLPELDQSINAARDAILQYESSQL